MAKMKSIDISNLQEQVLSVEDEPLCVERDGRVVGFFYPVKTKPRQQTDELWERLDAVLDRAAAESGMDRDAFIDAIDPSKPFPFEVGKG
jgi:hypothetical protein